MTFDRGPIKEAKDSINMVASRIYDTQSKLDMWNDDFLGGETQDLSAFFADLHLKVSGAYEIWTHNELLPEALRDGPAEDVIEEDLSSSLLEIVQSCLGLLRKQGKDVGALLVNSVIVQAQAAAEGEVEAEAEVDAAAEGEAEAEEPADADKLTGTEKAEDLPNGE